MNRALVAIVLVLASLSVAAVSGELRQPPRDEETGKFCYQEVVAIANVSAEELYSRAKAWVATAYRSANDVIQLDDPSTGRLIAKGNFSVTFFMNDAWVRYTLTLEVKEGRFRYTLTDFTFDNGYWSAPLEKEKKFTGQKKKLFRQVVEHAERTIAELKDAMTTSSPVGDEEW